MNISDTKTQIARGARQHLGQLGGMAPWEEGEYERESYSGFCVAMQILGMLHPETNNMDAWTGAEVREFAMACGVTEEQAERLIRDEDPLAIY